MTENPGNSSPRVGANSASSGTEPSPATSTTPEGAKMGVRRKGETEETERRPYSPLELRLQLYNEVHGLRGEGLSYTRIIEAIERRHGVTLSRSHISQWLRGIHRPGGSCNHFDAKPSPALSYIVGTVLSDGNLDLHGDHYYDILLKEVKDREYAYEFSRCLAEVLGRRKPYAIQRRRERWIVEAGSILLYNFLRQPLRKLMPYIEHCKDCAATFLGAFFDGEGSIRGRQLTVYNTNKQLLIYIKSLLKKYFDIDATGPHIGMKKGTIMHCPRTKKAYKANKDCYYIYIRRHSLPTFHKDVGFTIERKQRRLAEAAKK